MIFAARPEPIVTVATPLFPPPCAVMVKGPVTAPAVKVPDGEIVPPPDDDQTIDGGKVIGLAN